MKFAKELEENAVPEWRVKYLDYKQGKKKLKAVGRAVRTVERSPRNDGQQNIPSIRDGPVYSFLRARGWPIPGGNDGNGQLPSEHPSSIWHRQDDVENGTSAIPVPDRANERSPLRQQEDRGSDGQPQLRRYGSILASPPGASSPILERSSTRRTQASLLELPDPALGSGQSNEIRRSETNNSYDRPVSPGTDERADQLRQLPHPPSSQMRHTGNAYEIRRPTDLVASSSRRSGLRSALSLTRSNSLPPGGARPPLLKRVFSVAAGSGSMKASNRNHDVALEAYRELDFRKAEFFHFLDSELEKVESFYKEKEDEAKGRMEALREQLHMLRDMRVRDLEAAERRKNNGHHASNGDVQKSRDEDEGDQQDPEARSQSRLPGLEHLQRARHSVVAQVDEALDKVRTGHIGKTARAMRDLGTPLQPPLEAAHSTDYSRKQQPAVTYRVAKRQLKHAFTEYYHSLNLLRSYSFLNQKAFRKMTKKFDKTVPGGDAKQWYKDKVDEAYYTCSDILDILVLTAESYYARYFERGDNLKLRAYFRQPGYKDPSCDGALFRGGSFIGLGVALAINGLIRAIADTQSPYQELAVEATFLLQIYAGYFLIVFFFAMFCMDCRLWKRHQINYGHIFEFSRRHDLDWRQLIDAVSIFMFYLGLIMTLNFDWVGKGTDMYTYWPVVLLSISVFSVFVPVPGLYHRSRLWLIKSLFRLMFPGIYRVEFRDLFIGDVFCSLTYVFGNLPLTFCLYANNWNDPPQCGSSHSVTFAVLTTIPGIIRTLQCIRRAIRKGAWWPQMYNCGKYCCTIAMYAMLGAYRLSNHSDTLLWGFIAAASVNSVVCIIWDVAIDWSFGVWTGDGFLRKHMLFGANKWYYYAAVVLDVLLRFNWVFYVAFRYDDQHSSIVSFFVALSEVFRRGIWAIFRVENEQISFSKKLMAVRKPKLPFSASAAPVEEPSNATTWPSSLLETWRSVGTALQEAHNDDYVRRPSRPAPKEDDSD